MKKMYFLAALMMAAIALSAQDYDPQWMQDLRNLNAGLIDSTRAFLSHKDAPDYRTYIIYFNQPLDHANPQGPHFPMRALITVNTNGDPTKAVNHVYCSGYAIDRYSFYQPDSIHKYTANDCSREIAQRYDGNYIQIEHRYFQYSAPANCWENLDYLTAQAAATDFHNLFEALKKVLKGKWVMSGVSKGGITTLLQHNFYPNDMDIYVPYSAPFFDSDRTLGMQTYWNNVGWNPELNDLFMTIRKAGTNKLVEGKNTPWNIFYFYMNGTDTSKAHVDTTYAAYLDHVAGFGFIEKAYSDTAEVRNQIHFNDSVIHSVGYNAYNDTVYAYILMKDTFRLTTFKPWLDTLRKYNRQPQQQLPARHYEHRIIRPFGVTEKEWWGTDTAHLEIGSAYDYQSKRELGYFDVRFDELCATPEEAASLNNFWITHAGCSRDFSTPFFASQTFSRALYDQVMVTTQNATKPILLLYGLDDPWAGAAVKDQYINGQNVQKFILPAQNHIVHFTSNADITQCNAIRAALDAVLSAPQGIEEVDEQPLRGEKILRNGQILILRGGKTYTLQGQRVQ